jgi:hypothetical protein
MRVACDCMCCPRGRVSVTGLFVGGQDQVAALRRQLSGHALDHAEQLPVRSAAAGYPRQPVPESGVPDSAAPGAQDRPKLPPPVVPPSTPGPTVGPGVSSLRAPISTGAAAAPPSSPEALYDRRAAASTRSPRGDLHSLSAWRRHEKHEVHSRAPGVAHDHPISKAPAADDRRFQGRVSYAPVARADAPADAPHWRASAISSTTTRFDDASRVRALLPTAPAASAPLCSGACAQLTDGLMVGK